MANRYKNGFTIIEVMLVLGVSGLLLLMGFFGQGEVRRQAQFTDSMERIVSQLEAIQSEATRAAAKTSHGCGVADPGKNPDCILFGKVVEFQADESEFLVRTLIADRAKPDNSPLDRTTRVLNPRFLTEPTSPSPIIETVEMKWGVKSCIPKPTSATLMNIIVFSRHSGNGQAETSIHINLANTVNAPSYSDGQIKEHTFYFQGPGNDLARITLNKGNTVNTVFLEFLGKADCDTY